MNVIAITGGIGSGKSMVARTLSAIGFKVYDCDSQAKRIMDSDPAIKNAIRAEISPNAIDPDGNIDRRILAGIVFNDPDKLSKLNAIVHGAVRHDIQRWINANSHRNVLFIETAILYQSGLDAMVDRVIEVTADTDVRIARVCRRDGLSPEQVMQRIESQRIDVANPHPHVTTIDNSGNQLSVIPQLVPFLKLLH